MNLDLSKALKSRLLLLVGEEEVLRRRALDELLSTAGFQKDDFDLESFVADSTKPREWIGSVGTAPFMAERRCAVVRNILRTDPDPTLTKELTSLPPSSLLILVADDEAGSEDRVLRMKTTVRKGWEKLVGAAGGTVLAFEPDSKGSRTAVLAEIKRMGKTITPSAADALIEMTGGSLSRAIDEIEKVILFVGDAEQIKESDVREIVVPSREWNVFKMVEATLEGRVPEALRQLRVLIASNSKAEDTAFRNILPNVSSQLRLVWQARILIEAGKTARDAPREVVEQFATKPNITKEKDWRQARAMNIARSASFDKLTACFSILNDTDSRLKGILTGFSALETLELMILEMSGTIASRPAARR